jgi:hypothetical protein
VRRQNCDLGENWLDPHFRTQVLSRFLTQLDCSRPGTTTIAWLDVSREPGWHASTFSCLPFFCQFRLHSKIDNRPRSKVPAQEKSRSASSHYFLQYSPVTPAFILLHMSNRLLRMPTFHPDGNQAFVIRSQWQLLLRYSAADQLPIVPLMRSRLAKQPLSFSLAHLGKVTEKIRSCARKNLARQYRIASRNGP